MGIAGAAGNAPGVPVGRPRRAVLQQHEWLAGGRSPVDEQQPGRAVASPVPVTQIATNPAVAVMLHGMSVPAVTDADQRDQTDVSHQVTRTA